MNDYIKREGAIRAIAEQVMYEALIESCEACDIVEEWDEYGQSVLKNVPSAEVVECEIADNTTMIIKSDKWENIGRVILTNNDTKFGKVLYADEEKKRGEWKRRIVDNGFNADWVCSECGYRVKTDFVDYNFCPNCGADMREREGE